MKAINRKTLAKYALLLGPGSIADQALRYYYAKLDEGCTPKIKLLNAGFAITAGGATKYFK